MNARMGNIGPFMLYFAYGSMMDFGEMRKRCPSAQFVAVARLPDHSLQFTRRSVNRGCGVADAVPQQGRDMWGAVYDLAEIDFARLDVSEGFRPGRPLNVNSYVRKQRHVYRDGAEDQPILVWIYLGNPQPNPPLPNAVYKKLIVEGAKFWHLPKPYQAELERIEIAQVPPTPLPPSYADICDKVWSLWQTQGGGLVHDQPRNLLFPPPPRSHSVDLLFVGISPNHFAPIQFGRDRHGVEEFARKFEYVSTPGNQNTGMHYDAYYGELLAFARRIDPRFGAWRQVERNQSALLVEFTDCLHLATIPGDAADIGQFFQTYERSVWAACKEILESELLLYQPRVVIGNGRAPSDMLWEICLGQRPGGPPQDSVLLNTRFGCNMHLSGFIGGKQMDGYSRARLVREIQEHSPFS